MRTRDLLRIEKAIGEYAALNRAVGYGIGNRHVAREHLSELIDRSARVRRILHTMIDKAAGHDAAWGK